MLMWVGRIGIACMCSMKFSLRRVLFGLEISDKVYGKRYVRQSCTIDDSDVILNSSNLWLLSTLWHVHSYQYKTMKLNMQKPNKYYLQESWDSSHHILIHTHSRHFSATLSLPCLLPHFLFDPTYRANPAIDNSSVHLSHAGARIENLSSLSTIRDATSCEDNFSRTRSHRSGCRVGLWN